MRLNVLEVNVARFGFIWILSILILSLGAHASSDTLACYEQINITAYRLPAGATCTSLPDQGTMLFIDGILSLSNGSVVTALTDIIITGKLDAHNFQLNGSTYLEVLQGGELSVNKSELRVRNILVQNASLSANQSLLPLTILVSPQSIQINNTWIHNLSVTDSVISLFNMTTQNLIGIDSMVNMYEGNYSAYDLVASTINYYRLLEVRVQSEFGNFVEGAKLVPQFSPQVRTSDQGSASIWIQLYSQAESKQSIGNSLEVAHPLFKPVAITLPENPISPYVVVLETTKRLVPTGAECIPPRKFCTAVNPISCGVVKPLVAGGSKCTVSFVVNATDNIPQPTSSLPGLNFTFFAIVKSSLLQVQDVLTNTTTVRIVD